MTRSTNTDFRRIQDNDGDYLDFGNEGSIHSKACETVKTMDGEMWYGEMVVDSLADGSSCTILISTATDGCGAYPHGRFVVVASGAVTVEFNENPTVADGEAIPIHNINRRDVSTPDSVTLKKNPTVTNNGTSLETLHEGSATANFFSPGEPGTGELVFWVLKSGEDYIVKVTNFSGAAIKVKLAYQFHEHTI